MADLQGLGDILAGAAGHPVNRPALDRYVATAQATNGLHSAQTEEALLNAQKARDEQTAYGQLEDNLANVTDANGKPIFNRSQARFAAGQAIATHGGVLPALQAVQEGQKIGATTTLGDVASLGTPAATAAGQVMSGKPAEPIAAHDEMILPAGVAAPTVVQTPLGVAKTHQADALAGLNVKKTNDPGAFHGSGGPTDPNALELGAYTLYKTGNMPSMGMGNGGARLAMMQRAAEMANQEQQTGQPFENAGFDRILSRKQDYAAGTKAVAGFASGTQGNQVRSINNVVGHLQLFEDTFDALQNGDVQALNSLNAGWQKQFGKPVPATLSAMSQVIGPELLKSLVTTGAGTGPEREHFAEQAGSLSNAPEQTHSAVQALRGMLGRQLQDFELQYANSTGRDDFTKKLPPDVQKMLKSYEGGIGVEPLGGAVKGGPNPAALSAPPPPQVADETPPPAAALAGLQEGGERTFGNQQTWTIKNGKPVRVR